MCPSSYLDYLPSRSMVDMVVPRLLILLIASHLSAFYIVCISSFLTIIVVVACSLSLCHFLVNDFYKAPSDHSDTHKYARGYLHIAA